MDGEFAFPSDFSMAHRRQWKRETTDVFNITKI